MLFNSPIFLFGFLPIVVVVYFGLLDRGWLRGALNWLAVSSLFFYGWWNPTFLLVILTSIAFNLKVALKLSEGVCADQRPRGWLVFGIGANLALLGYFKYLAFGVETVNALLSQHWAVPQLVLPLGISFFTFQKIAYLVDAYRGQVREHDLVRYTTFVMFFPQLIAGPIVHHAEIVPQLARGPDRRRRTLDLAMGLSLFSVGLFKKVVVADGIAPFANEVFAAAQQGSSLSCLDAWVGALAYSLQLYFDFSGYSDMAIGLGRMFGVSIPINFDSPYKASSIIDFWRRWHMTLSRFLRDYLYIPLGGGRCGHMRRYFNVFLTMLLGGIWHGAGWTFIVWGIWHGILLVGNHAWKDIVGASSIMKESTVWRNETGRWFTFLAVLIGWVIFRSADIGTAGRILSAMFSWVSSEEQSSLIASGVWWWLVVLLVVVRLAPNTQQWTSAVCTCWSESGQRHQLSLTTRLSWQPRRAWAVVLAIVTNLSLLHLTRVSEFLYFQF